MKKAPAIKIEIVLETPSTLIPFAIRRKKYQRPNKPKKKTGGANLRGIFAEFNSNLNRANRLPEAANKIPK
jgi:hypothetical protein